MGVLKNCQNLKHSIRVRVGVRVRFRVRVRVRVRVIKLGFQNNIWRHLLNIY